MKNYFGIQNHIIINGHCNFLLTSKNRLY